jgi:hypothetical protein
MHDEKFKLQDTRYNDEETRHKVQDAELEACALYLVSLTLFL